MKFSDQAIGALMMALQKCIMEQSDIVGILQEFELQVNEREEVIVRNSPVLHYDDKSSNTEINFQDDETKTTVGSD